MVISAIFFIIPLPTLGAVIPFFQRLNTGLVAMTGPRALARVAVFALGVALPPVAAWLMQPLSVNERVGAVGVALLGVLAARIVVPTASGLRLGLAFVGTALVVGWLWP